MKIMTRRYIVPLLTAVILGTLLAITLSTYFYRTRQLSGQMMSQEVLALADVFEKIHETCEIIDFDYQKNRINFLNVVSFVGSEVGPMNLVHPEKWEGPYLDDNPTMQKKSYMVVRTHQGYFITPGMGVQLPNGKVIGKDIILDEDADIAEMMRDPDALLWQGKVLAAPLRLEREIPSLEQP